jgi:hypothetical protein
MPKASHEHHEHRKILFTTTAPSLVGSGPVSPSLSPGDSDASMDPLFLWERFDSASQKFAPVDLKSFLVLEAAFTANQPNTSLSDTLQQAHSLHFDIQDVFALLSRIHVSFGIKQQLASCRVTITVSVMQSGILVTRTEHQKQSSKTQHKISIKLQT